VASFEQALELGGLTARQEATAHDFLQKAKDSLAAELAAAPAGGSASGIVPEALQQALLIEFEKIEPTEVLEELDGGWDQLPSRNEANRLFEQEQLQESIEQFKVSLAELPKSQKRLRASCYVIQHVCFRKLGKDSLEATVAAMEEESNYGYAWAAAAVRWASLSGGSRQCTASRGHWHWSRAGASSAAAAAAEPAGRRAAHRGPQERCQPPRRRPPPATACGVRRTRSTSR